MLNQSYTDVVAKAYSEYSVERASVILSLFSKEDKKTVGLPGEGDADIEMVVTNATERKSPKQSADSSGPRVESDDEEDEEVASKGFHSIPIAETIQKHAWSLPRKKNPKMKCLQ